MMKFDQPARKQPEQVSKEDIEKIFELAPSYANKFYIVFQQDGTVRIIFADADALTGITTPRASIIIPAMAYQNFADLIDNNKSNASAMLAAMGKQIHDTKPVTAVIDGGKNLENLE